MTNKEYAEKDVNFKKCCEAAGVPATKRQASKFRNKKGKAFQFRFPTKEEGSG